MLLLVILLATTATIYDWISSTTPSMRNAVRAAADCGTGPVMPIGGALTDASSVMAQSSAEYYRCIAPMQRLRLVWIGGGVALLAGAAGLIFSLVPAYLRRSRGLGGLDPVAAAGLIETMRVLALEVGLAGPPRVLVAPLRRTADGTAFGAPWRRYVGLNAGLVLLHAVRPAAFRAVVLHELGHIRNSDVDKTFLTMAGLLSFALAGLLPFGVVLTRVSILEALGILLRVTVLSAIAAALGAAILRRREHYADLRAAVVGGDLTGLCDLLRGAPTMRERWLGRWFAVHPGPERRINVLADPSLLFVMPFAELLGVGLGAGLTLGSIGVAFEALRGAGFRWVDPSMLLGMLLAALLCGTVGIGAWRAAVSGLAGHERVFSPARMSAALAMGLVLGQLLALDSISDTWVGVGLATWVAYKLGWAVWLGLSFWWALLWLRSVAGAWLPVALRFPAPARAFVPAKVAAVVALGVWLAPLLLIENVAPVAFSAFSNSGYATVLAMLSPVLFPLAAFALTLYLLQTQWLAAVALVLLWAYPLAGALLSARAPVPAGASWVFLGRRPLPPWRPRMPSMRRAIVVGVAVAVAYLVLLVAGWLAIRLVVPASARAQDSYALGIYAAGCIGCLLFQSVAATAAAAGSLSAPAPTGLLAAFVAGALGVCGFQVTVVAFGGSTSAAFAWNAFVAFVLLGGVTSIPAAVLGAALGAWRQPRFQPAPIVA
ncbi:MAG: M48 family metalloprotease [Chloroflexota bacterium]